MKKIYVARVVLGIWIYLWILFSIIPYFTHKDPRAGSAALIALSPSGKKIHLLGASLYEFIQFCHKSVPGSARYYLAGVNPGELLYVQALYELYPHVTYFRSPPKDAPPPDYIFAYDQEQFYVPGYELYKRLDDRRFILKRTEPHVDF